MTITLASVKGLPLSVSEADGNISDLDTRTKAGWRDLICGLETRSGPTQPVLQNFRNGIYLYAFSPDIIQEAFATAHIDHDYDYGTALYPHMHFTTDTTNTGTVRWGFEYTAAQRRDGALGFYTFGPTTTVYVDHVVDNVAYSHYVAEVSTGNAIDGTNIDTDTVILFRVFRDATHANDTYPDPVYGFTFDLHYQSARYATPNKAAPFI